jgi:hypothetical protein
MTQAEIFQRIDKYVGDQQDKLLKNIGYYEKILLQRVIDEFVSQLVLDGGNIKSNGNNIQLTEAIDKIFNEFKNNQQRKFIDGFMSALQNMNLMESEYFEKSEGVERKTFENVRKEVEMIVRERIGITKSGSIAEKGFLDNFINDDNLKNLVKNHAVDSVTGGSGLSAYTEGLRFLIVGHPGAESEVSKHFKTFAYDTYQQYDRTVAKVYADKLNLNYAVYTGGLIESSRQFCIDKNGKVFTRAEIEAWRNDPNLPKDRGGRVVNYNPFTDCGRWNCRHRLRWISFERAIELRPELAFAA